MSNGDFIGLTAEYVNGENILIIGFESYQNKPSMQVEKTDAPVETFVVNDTMVYLLELRMPYRRQGHKERTAANGAFYLCGRIVKRR